MASTQTASCEQCSEHGRPTRRYEVSADDGRRAILNLCAEHAAGLEAILVRFDGQGVRRRRTTRFVTIEQIEAEKGASNLS